MEHIIVTDLQNGYFKLVPEEGYRMYNRYNHEYYSEAVTKNIGQYKAEKI